MCEHKRFSASPETPHILWNSNIYYHVHHIPALVIFWARLIQLTLSQTISLRHVLILSRHLCLGLEYFSPKFLMCLSSPPHLLHAPPISSSLITLITSSEQYKSWSSLCSFLHSPVSTSLLAPDTFPSTLFSITLSPFSTLNTKCPVFTLMYN